MAIRYLKIILVTFVSLLCILYASQNVANLRAAHGFVAATFGMQGNTLYPDAFGTAITSPALAWLALATIIELQVWPVPVDRALCRSLQRCTRCSPNPANCRIATATRAIHEIARPSAVTRCRVG